MTTWLYDGKPLDEELIEVPRKIAVCPECCSTFHLDGIDEWDTDTGEPLEVSVTCPRDAFGDPENDPVNGFRHQHWQGEWMTPIARVLAWAQRHIRVRVG